MKLGFRLIICLGVVFPVGAADAGPAADFVKLMDYNATIASGANSVLGILPGASKVTTLTSEIDRFDTQLGGVKFVTDSYNAYTLLRAGDRLGAGISASSAVSDGLQIASTLKVADTLRIGNTLKVAEALQGAGILGSVSSLASSASNFGAAVGTGDRWNLDKKIAVGAASAEMVGKSAAVAAGYLLGGARGASTAAGIADTALVGGKLLGEKIIDTNAFKAITDSSLHIQTNEKLAADLDRKIAEVKAARTKVDAASLQPTNTTDKRIALLTATPSPPVKPGAAVTVGGTKATTGTSLIDPSLLQVRTSTKAVLNTPIVTPKNSLTPASPVRLTNTPTTSSNISGVAGSGSSSISTSVQTTTPSRITSTPSATPHSSTGTPQSPTAAIRSTSGASGAASNAASSAAGKTAASTASRTASTGASTAASSAASKAASSAASRTASTAASSAASSAAGRAASGAASNAASRAASSAASNAASRAAANAASNAAANAASRIRIPSDIRLKQDIVPLDRTHDGLQLYRYRYLGSDTVYVGVMAQEVARRLPNAVTRGAHGYLQVDYQQLGVEFLTFDQWTARQAVPASH